MLPSAVNNSYKCRGNFLKTILEIEKHNEKFRDKFCIKNDISCSFFVALLLRKIDQFTCKIVRKENDIRKLYFFAQLHKCVIFAQEL